LSRDICFYMCQPTSIIAAAEPYEVYSAADEQLPKNRNMTTFGPHGISLCIEFTELKLLLAFCTLFVFIFC